MSRTEYCVLVKLFGFRINDLNEGLEPFVEAHELENWLRSLKPKTLRLIIADLNEDE